MSVCECKRKSTEKRLLELSETYAESIVKPGITGRQIPGQVSPLQKPMFAYVVTMSTFN